MSPYLCVLVSKPAPDDIPYDPSPFLNGYRWKLQYLHPDDLEGQIRSLMEEGVDVFINLVDGTPDDEVDGNRLVLALEAVNAAFTGAGAVFFDPTREQMKAAACRADVPTPGWHFANSAAEAGLIAQKLKFPMLVKPVHGYASMGISPASRVDTPEALAVQIQLCVEKFGCALVEEFIEGREFTCLVAENPDDPQAPLTFTPVEFVFPPGETFKHYHLKWVDYRKMSVAPVLDEGIEQVLREQTARVFRALQGSGYARCDYRMGADGRIYMLEINPNCGIFYPPDEPGSADFSLMCDPSTDHRGFLELIIRNALRRQAGRSG